MYPLTEDRFISLTGKEGLDMVKVKDFMLECDEMLFVDNRMSELSKQGVVVSHEASGELNFSGCHRGYCQAWD